MFGITITRNQYNTLVEEFPDWMATVWQRLDRQWTLQTVNVQGTYELIASLQSMI